MFRIYRGKESINWFPKAASTAFSNGALVAPNGSGQVIPATSSTTQHIGLFLKDVAATDSDYASTTLCPVMLIHDDCEFLADITTGTLTTAMVGSSYDLTDSLGINVTSQTYKVVTIKEFISATKAVVKFNSNLFSANKGAYTM